MDRDPTTGRFVAGNAAAVGHRRPHAARVAELRAELFETLTRERLHGVLVALLEKAQGGDVAAARLVLSYALGEPVAEDIVARIEELEEALL